MLCKGDCGKPAVLGHPNCMYGSRGDAHMTDRMTYGQEIFTGAKQDDYGYRIDTVLLQCRRCRVHLTSPVTKRSE